ncbi:PREDICTED: defensin-like protein 229 [Camelina sativa]|uniref:Defensin-like protein 229 n=1 Tax=Camelina sativa TaxID=90675 RepID=A0ABM1RCS0_CAMSA|nr:PREDICTED: defensin-like protein 229 [Camelina sativa]
MKSSTLFMVSCILIASIYQLFIYMKSVENKGKKVRKVCTKAQIFKENCGMDGNKTCIKGFNKIKEYPFHCDCELHVRTESRRVCISKFPTTPC